MLSYFIAVCFLKLLIICCLKELLSDSLYITLQCFRRVDNIAPGFHHWFKKRRSDIFIDCCLVFSSRERHGISTRITTNGLELKHRLQKKVLTE